jgi:hypothetical protein
LSEFTRENRTLVERNYLDECNVGKSEEEFQEKIDSGTIGEEEGGGKENEVIVISEQVDSIEKEMDEYKVIEEEATVGKKIDRIVTRSGRMVKVPERLNL